MKRQIRKNVFETNSSSTHAICITKNDIDITNIPTYVTFTSGEFGWEFDVHNDTWTKASYLYQLINDINYNNEEKRVEYLDKLISALSIYGITCEFEPVKRDKWGFTHGYVDHYLGAKKFLDAVLENDNLLLKFLFDNNSKIITGNDNGDTFFDYMDSHGFVEDGYDYSHPDYEKVFYKGN